MKPDAWFHYPPPAASSTTRMRWPVQLANKQIAGAGLDVWEDEPPPHDHPLMAFDNVIVSPHIAGSTIEARENMGRIAA